MSLVVVAIGLSHGIPIVGVALLSRSRIGVALSAIVMAGVAIVVGGSRYLGADLLGVALATYFSWGLLDPSDRVRPIAMPEANAEAQRTFQNQTVDIANAIWNKWFAEFAQGKTIDIANSLWNEMLAEAEGGKQKPPPMPHWKDAVIRYARASLGDGKLCEEDTNAATLLCIVCKSAPRDLYIDILRRGQWAGLMNQQTFEKTLENFDIHYQAELDRQETQREAELSRRAMIEAKKFLREREERKHKPS
jgi:hypothetical protein